MMYLVNTLAVGAAAVELRNLDVASGKITLNSHGLSDGQLVGLSGTSDSNGIAAKTLYAVSDKTTNDFKLKTVKAADLTADAAHTITGATAQVLAGVKLQTYGAKKCQLTGGKKDAAGTDKANIMVSTTCGAQKIKKTDEMIVYCTGAANSDKCKLDGTETKFPHWGSVWVLQEDSNKFQVDQTKPPATGTDNRAAEAFGADSAANTGGTGNEVWLVSKDAAYLYPGQPAAHAHNTWDTTANEGLCNGACKLANNTFYYYTGSTGGLTTKTVYHAQVAAATPWKFELNAVGTGNTAAKLNDDNVGVTDQGAGTYQKVTNGTKIKTTTGTDNKVELEAAEAAFAADTVVMFYCTGDKCGDYNITGAENGNRYKVKVMDGGNTKFTLKTNAATPADVAVSADAAGTAAGGYFYKVDAADSVTFPEASAGAGSAARSFAMLGSAVAMATAFLLA